MMSLGPSLATALPETTKASNAAVIARLVPMDAYRNLCLLFLEIRMASERFLFGEGAQLGSTDLHRKASSRCFAT